MDEVLGVKPVGRTMYFPAFASQLLCIAVNLQIRLPPIARTKIMQRTARCSTSGTAAVIMMAAKNAASTSKAVWRFVREIIVADAAKRRASAMRAAPLTAGSTA